MDKKIAIFPGTFDPITKGHTNIIERAVQLFDQLIVAIGENPEKKPFMPLEQRVLKVQNAVQHCSNIEIKNYQGLTVDFCKQVDAKFIVRGLRNAFDFEYEKNMAYINEKIGNIKTIFFVGNPDTIHISSSVVKELQRQGKDVSEFLP